MFYNFKSVLWHPGHKWLFVRLPLRINKIGKESIWIDYPLLCDKIWKEYYGIRNQVFFAIREKGISPKKKVKRLIHAVIDIILKVVYGNSKVRRIGYLLLALFDGIVGKMGIRIKPF